MPLLQGTFSQDQAMAAAASSTGDAVEPGTAPTQPGPATKYVLEHPEGTTKILGTYKGSGRVAGKVRAPCKHKNS